MEHLIYPVLITYRSLELSDWLAVGGKQFDDIREFYEIIASQSFNEKTITVWQLENINI